MLAYQCFNEWRTLEYKTKRYWIFFISERYLGWFHKVKTLKRKSFIVFMFSWYWQWKLRHVCPKTTLMLRAEFQFLKSKNQALRLFFLFWFQNGVLNWPVIWFDLVCMLFYAIQEYFTHTMAASMLWVGKKLGNKGKTSESIQSHILPMTISDWPSLCPTFG